MRRSQLLTCMIAATTSLFPTTLHAAENKRFNVLFITADDLGLN